MRLILCILFTNLTLVVFSHEEETTSADSVYYSFDTAFKNCLSVKELYITDYNFEEIPQEINCLKNLEYFVLKNSKVKCLPEEIGELKKLKVLSIWHSNITVIPSSIQNLKNLVRLEIVGAKITEIGDFVGKLEKLEYLNFLGNKISVVSDKILEINRLKKLTICTWNGDVRISESTKKMISDKFQDSCLLDW